MEVEEAEEVDEVEEAKERSLAPGFAHGPPRAQQIGVPAEPNPASRLIVVLPLPSSFFVLYLSASITPQTRF
jgi:hypothetical protein